MPRSGTVQTRPSGSRTSLIARETVSLSAPYWSHPATFPGQCAFDGGATTVTFDLNDPQHTGVTDVLGTGAYLSRRGGEATRGCGMPDLRRKMPYGEVHECAVDGGR